MPAVTLAPLVDFQYRARGTTRRDKAYVPIDERRYVFVNIKVLGMFA